MVSIGLLALRLAIARPVIRRVAGLEPPRRHGRLRGRLDARARRDRRVPRGVATASTRCARLRRRRARAALADDRLRPRLRRPASSASRSSSLAACDRDLGRPARARAALGRRAARAGGRARRRGGRAARSPASRATPPRPRRAALASRSTGCTSVAGSLWLGGLVGLLVLWSQPARALRPSRARRRRAALLERRARVGARAARLRDLGLRAPPADPLGALDDLVREGDPDQGRRCSPLAMRVRGASTSCGRSRGSRRAGEPARRGGRAAAAARRRRGRDRRRGAVLAAALLSSLAPPVEVTRARRAARSRRSGRAPSHPSCTRARIR